MKARSGARALGHDDLLTPEDLAGLLKVPLKTVYNWRYRRVGPASFKVGAHVKYWQSEVDRWLDEQAQAGQIGTR